MLHIRMLYIRMLYIRNVVRILTNGGVHCESFSYVEKIVPETTGLKQYVGLSDWPGLAQLRLKGSLVSVTTLYRIYCSVSIQNQK